MENGQAEFKYHFALSNEINESGTIILTGS